jgi:hypothetical protein
MKPNLVDPKLKKKYLGKVKKLNRLVNKSKNSNEEDLTNWFYLIILAFLIIGGLIVYDKYQLKKNVKDNSRIY